MNDSNSKTDIVAAVADVKQALEKADKPSKVKVKKSKGKKSKKAKKAKLAAEIANEKANGASHDTLETITRGVAADQLSDASQDINRPVDALAEDISTDPENTESEIDQSALVSAVGSSPVPSDPTCGIRATATQMLIGATLVLVAMIGFGIGYGQAGINALRGFGGIGLAAGDLPHEKSLVDRALFLDLLLPLTYGAGFALFAFAQNRNGIRPLVRLVAALAIFAALADISENILTYPVLTGTAAATSSPAIWFTFIKYGLLGLASILISTILPGAGAFRQFTKYLLRFVVPIGLAALLANLIPAAFHPAVSVLYLIAIGSLALLAWGQWPRGNR